MWALLTSHAHPRAKGSSRRVSAAPTGLAGDLLAASLPHGQVEGVLHTGAQALPRMVTYAKPLKGPEVQHTPAGPLAARRRAGWG